MEGSATGSSAAAATMPIAADGSAGKGVVKTIEKKTGSAAPAARASDKTGVWKVRTQVLAKMVLEGRRREAAHHALLFYTGSLNE